MDGERVVIVGGGVGGLAAAVALASAGREVLLLEKAATVGGKMREAATEGRAVDAGPTVLTMRWVFDALFETAGARLDDHLTLEPAAILARHAWSDTQRLDLHASVDASADAIGAFAGAAEAAGYRAFCREAQAIYQTLRQPYLQSQQTGPIGLARRIGPTRIAELFAIRPFETLWSAISQHFQDPRLRQLFSRYATYCGSSPYAAPATLMLIAHVEQAGVWRVAGGMQRLAEALGALAKARGVVIRTNCEVSEVRTAGGRACGVTLSTGEQITAGQVVLNAEAAGLAVAGSAPAPLRARSLSAITWTLAARTQGFPLVRHNVFFSGDYAAEFDDIFRRGRPPAAPTVYVCAQDRGDGGEDVDVADRLLVLINAPARGDTAPLAPSEVAACEARVFDRLERCGLTVARPPGSITVTTPADFNRLFPGSGGALYGRATHGWGGAFQRPGARTPIPGLYLAGGGAHPGAGVPMAALSGLLAAERLLKDQASTRRFHPGATPGGTSTP